MHTHINVYMYTFTHISDLLLNSVAITNVQLVATYGKLRFHVPKRHGGPPKSECNEIFLMAYKFFSFIPFDINCICIYASVLYVIYFYFLYTFCYFYFRKTLLIAPSL